MHQNNKLGEKDCIDWKAIFRKTYHNGLAILRKNEASWKYFPVADVLVTDHTSACLYYLPANRPILFYNHPGVAYEAGAIILKLRDLSYNIDNVDHLKTDIKKACDQFQKGCFEELATLVCSYRGKSLQRYEQEIYELLGIERYSQ